MALRDRRNHLERELLGPGCPACQGAPPVAVLRGPEDREPGPCRACGRSPVVLDRRLVPRPY